MFVCMCSTIAAEAISYDLVLVGNAGNSNDSTGFGAVSYNYRIGKYKVTIGQYTVFLNAVAADDTYNLYNTSMAAIPNVAGISRTGTSEHYSYSVMENGGSSANRPITSISWFNAARFANWMANGQPTGSQDDSTTEDGAYPLHGATSGDALAKNSTNPNTGSAPTFYIPTENEWYKAAYYSPALSGGAGGYYLYATQSNSLPGNSIGAETNQANYISEATGYCVTQSSIFSSSQNYLTDVGAFSNSSSYYGTYDQTGLAWEWNDFNGATSASRGLRGGAYTSAEPYLKSTYRMGYAPERYNPNGGFRLASTS